MTSQQIRETVASMRMSEEDKEILLRRALAGEPEARLAVFWAAQRPEGGR
jgi:hypothetical protein